MEFRWNQWNLDHIAEHGISAGEAEFVANRARPPFPEIIGQGKWIVMGKTYFGDYIQVVYVLDDPTDPDPEKVYVIHARPLTEHEKRKYRRRTR